MILILALALFLVCCLLLVLTFRTAYYSPANRKEDPRHIPSSEQYQQVAEGIQAAYDAGVPVIVVDAPVKDASLAASTVLQLSCEKIAVLPGKGGVSGAGVH